MKKIRFLLIALVAGIGAGSCTKTDLQPVPAPGAGEPAVVPVSVSAAPYAAATDGFTKAATELTTEQDAKIYDLWAIQYDGSGKLLGTPYYTIDMPEAGPGSTGIDATYSMEIKLTACAETGGKVYFIANTGDSDLFREDNVATEADLKALAQHLTGEYQPGAAKGIPMLGLYTGAVSSSSPIGNVEMKRLVAKIILRYKSSLDDFEFTSVQLRNVAANIYYGPEPAAGSDFPAKGEDSHFDYPAETLSEAADDEGYKKFVWYVPENFRKATAAVPAAGDRTPDKTDGKATGIEIAGILREGDRCRKGTLNVLLGDLGTGGAAYDNFDVKRNTAYVVTVDLKGLNEGDYRLTVESYDMSNSAMIVPGSGDEGAVTFDIRKCLNNGFTSAEDLKGMLGASSTLTADVLWQDGNVINTADVSLDTENGLLTVRSSKATKGNAVVALYPNATKAQGTILWSWHIWVTDYRPDEAGVATRTENTAYTVTGGQVHTYGTEYQKANPNKVIMDRNLGATTGYYGAPSTSDRTSFGMFYQWGRKDPFPYWDGVVAWPAKIITIYGPDGTTTMPENGTGYKQVAASTAISGANNLAYAVKNPLTYIYNADAPSDWYATDAANQNDDLWGSSQYKGVCDPCPKGWRVAPIETWDDFKCGAYAAPFYYYVNGEKQTAGNSPAFTTSGRNGRLYEAGNVKAWYPASGSRNLSTGKFENFGYHGYFWSSSVGGISGVYVGFNSGWLGVHITTRRAAGFTVRCIQYVE